MIGITDSLQVAVVALGDARMSTWAHPMPSKIDFSGKFRQLLDRFTMGVLHFMTEQPEQQKDVVSLLADMVKAMQEQAVEHAHSAAGNVHKRNRTIAVGGLGISVASLLTIVFWGGAMYQRVNYLEARDAANSAAIIALTTTNSSVITSIQAFSQQLKDMNEDMRHMRDRFDKVADQKAR